MRNDVRCFSIALTSAFFVVLGVLMLNHEMWRDELHIWLLAKNSHSLDELLRHNRYEGHPLLWPLCLYVLTRIIAEPEAMQLFHIVIATASVYVVAQFAPFTRIQKALFAFGYFPLFEYGVISRNYAIGVFCVFAFCAAISAPQRSQILAWGLLLALASTSIFGMILAAALAAVLMIPEISEWSTSGRKSIERLKFVAGIVALLAVGAATLFHIMPPEDSGLRARLFPSVELYPAAATAASVWRSFVPLPSAQFHFWESNILRNWPQLQTVLSLVMLLALILCLCKRPRAVVLFTLGTLALLSFGYFGARSLRHRGHLFILFVAACWVAQSKDQLVARWKRFPSIFAAADRARPVLLSCILVLHLMAAAYAGTMDLLFPFSASKQAAAFVDHHFNKDQLILGHPDYAAEPIAARTGREIYYPNRGQLGTFIRWDNARGTVQRPEPAVEATKLAARTGQKILLILTDDAVLPRDCFVPVGSFTQSIVADEVYYLYLTSCTDHTVVSQSVGTSQ